MNRAADASRRQSSGADGSRWAALAAQQSRTEAGYVAADPVDGVSPPRRDYELPDQSSIAARDARKAPDPAAPKDRNIIQRHPWRSAFATVGLATTLAAGYGMFIWNLPVAHPGAGTTVSGAPVTLAELIENTAKHPIEITHSLGDGSSVTETVTIDNNFMAKLRATGVIGDLPFAKQVPFVGHFLPTGEGGLQVAEDHSGTLGSWFQAMKINSGIEGLKLDNLKIELSSKTIENAAHKYSAGMINSVEFTKDGSIVFGGHHSIDLLGHNFNQSFSFEVKPSAVDHEVNGKLETVKFDNLNLSWLFKTALDVLGSPTLTGLVPGVHISNGNVQVSPWWLGLPGENAQKVQIDGGVHGKFEAVYTR